MATRWFEVLTAAAAGKDETGIRTLVGENKDEGANHGRKLFKKTQKTPFEVLTAAAAGKDEIGIRTLVGENKDEGADHGRKLVKKTQKTLATRTGTRLASERL